MKPNKVHGPPKAILILKTPEIERTHSALMDLLLTIDCDLWDSDERVIRARKEFDAAIEAAGGDALIDLDARGRQRRDPV